MNPFDTQQLYTRVTYNKHNSSIQRLFNTIYQKIVVPTEHKFQGKANSIRQYYFLHKSIKK